MEDLPYGILLEAVQEHKKENIRQQRHTFPSHWPFKKSDSKELLVAPKGSLVAGISQNNSEANYKTLLEPNFLLCCKLDEVCKLNSVEKDLLGGVERLQDRIEILHKLDWVQKLRIGSLVYVAIPSKPIPVKGTIQYIGVLHGEIGTKFFVELMEEEEDRTNDDKDNETPSSESRQNQALFVSMDQLTQQASADAARVEELSPQPDQPSDQSAVERPLSKAFSEGLTTVDFLAVGIADTKAITRQQTALHKFEKKQKKTTQQSAQHKRIKQAQEELGLDDSSALDFSLLDKEKQRELLEAVAIKKAQDDPSTPNGDNPDSLEVGSRIQFGNPPCYGTIRWIGHLPSVTCTMAGVEVEKPVDVAGAYSDGWHKGVQLFQSESNRGLFLPLVGLHRAQQLHSSLSLEHESVQSLDAANKSVEEVKDTNSQIQLPNNVVTVDRLHLDMENMKAQFEEQLKRFMIKTEESIQLIQQDNLKKLLEVQTKNEQLQKQLSHTQQQLESLQSMVTGSSRMHVVARNEIVLGKEIGRGAWAAVSKAMFQGTSVAAKQLHSAIISSETKTLFKREMKIALSCRHPNIVAFLGAALDDDSPIILMELMDFNLRSAYGQGKVTDARAFKVAHEIATALHFLHTRPDPVIHRDVSSANVLLKILYNDEWLAKLGDLGTAKIQQETTTPSPGAWAYAAPEAPTPEKHSPKMDVYSFGVLIIETLTKTHPFQKVDTLKAQVQHQYPQYDQLVTSCTKQQLSHRPTMFDVLVQLDGIGAIGNEL